MRRNAIMFPLIISVLFHMTSSFADEASIESVVPIGHLEPLGGHRPADIIITEMTLVPDPWTFWDDYVELGNPLILRGAARESPAFDLWTDEYLKEHYADLEIRLEGKNEATSRIPVGAVGLGRDTIGSFLDHYRETDSYVISQLPEPMYRDVSVLRCMSCGNMGGRMVEVDLWMSSGETSSILHKDAFNQMNCLLRGTKRWKMIREADEGLIYPAWEPEREIGGRSAIDVSRVDLLKYPNITKVRWSDFTMYPGDCLFLPKGYYHQVTSDGSSNLAVSIHFSRIATFEDHDCDPANEEHTPLSEMDVLWSWSGHGIMSMGNLDVWDLRANYASLARREGVLTRNMLLKETALLFPDRMDEGYIEKFTKAWDVIDPDGKGGLTVDEILALDTQTMVEHTLGIDLAEQSNTLDFEYYYIDAEDIRSLLFSLMDRDGSVVKESFVHAYTTLPEYGGTEKFALEIWSKLDPADPDLATHEEIMANIDTALEDWYSRELVDLTPETDTSGQSILWHDDVEDTRDEPTKDEL